MNVYRKVLSEYLPPDLVNEVLKQYQIMKYKTLYKKVLQSIDIYGEYTNKILKLTHRSTLFFTIPSIFHIIMFETKIHEIKCKFFNIFKLYENIKTYKKIQKLKKYFKVVLSLFVHQATTNCPFD